GRRWAITAAPPAPLPTSRQTVRFHALLCRPCRTSTLSGPAPPGQSSLQAATAACSNRLPWSSSALARSGIGWAPAARESVSMDGLLEQPGKDLVGVEILLGDRPRGPGVARVVGLDLADGGHRLRHRRERQQALPRREEGREARGLHDGGPPPRPATREWLAEP